MTSRSFARRYLVKQKGLGRIFSREPGNLKAIHSYKYSVLVNQKSVSIEPAGVSADQPAGRGVAVSTRKGKPAVNKIANTRNQYILKKGGSRRTAGAVASIVGKRGYRADLLKDSVARSSVILKSQRPSTGRQTAKPRKVRGSKAKTLVHGAEATETEA
ncbi:60s ribosomal protein l28 [Ceraceosorus bombacis]|uniref:60s ribosomal protein l28 n=1 Tax=Ceraceosorus bombacis TaxID=401625 RepID=A0A0P1BAZ9_9BASI|nr:60s ribosomal protein l28 [Ceraceosorus bombacis]